jgi:hypothetical protein
MVLILFLKRFKEIIGIGHYFYISDKGDKRLRIKRVIA